MKQIDLSTPVSWSFSNLSYNLTDSAAQSLCAPKTGRLQDMIVSALHAGITDVTDMSDHSRNGTLPSAEKLYLHAPTNTQDLRDSGVEHFKFLDIHEVDGEAPDIFDIVFVAKTLGLTLPHGAALVGDLRTQVAEQAYQDADFDDWVIADAGGWEHDGGASVTRTVFLEMPSGPSLRMQFSVDFEPGTAQMVAGMPEFDLPANPAHLYGYYVNLDERGEFYADLRDASGTTVYELRSEEDGSLAPVEDGYMKHRKDMHGLEEMLKTLASCHPKRRF